MDEDTSLNPRSPVLVSVANGAPDLATAVAFEVSRAVVSFNCSAALASPHEGFTQTDFMRPDADDTTTTQYTYGGNTHSRSDASLVSINTVVETGVVMNLPHERLCTFIDTHRSMQGAEIVRSCTFVEKKRVAPHRCILLELHRPGRKNIWVRLERKPTSGAALVSGKGKTSSNDVVNTPMSARERQMTDNLYIAKCSLATDDAALISMERYKLDNAQAFDSRPSLGDLRPFLGVMQETLTEYTVWSVSGSLGSETIAF